MTRAGRAADALLERRAWPGASRGSGLAVRSRFLRSYWRPAAAAAWPGGRGTGPTSGLGPRGRREGLVRAAGRCTSWPRSGPERPRRSTAPGRGSQRAGEARRAGKPGGPGRRGEPGRRRATGGPGSTARSADPPRPTWRTWTRSAPSPGSSATRWAPRRARARGRSDSPPVRGEPGRIELTVADQVVAPFALTRLLLPAARGGGPVITVSSGGMYTQRLDLAALPMTPPGYRGVTAYAGQAGSGGAERRVGAADRPGPGRLPRHAPRRADARAGRRAAAVPAAGAPRVLRTPEQGADTIVWLATADAGPLGTGGSGTTGVRGPNTGCRGPGG